MRWFGKRITYHGLLPLSCSWQRTRLTGIGYGNVLVKGHKAGADEAKKWAVLTCNTEYPRGFQFASGNSLFRSSAIKTDVFHSILSILHTDKAMKLVRRHKFLLRRWMCSSGIRGVSDGNGHLSLYRLAMKNVSMCACESLPTEERDNHR